MKSRALPTVLDDLHREELLYPPQQWVNKSTALLKAGEHSRLENLPALGEKRLCCSLPWERDR